MLTSISRSRGLQGLTPGETAMFVFSLKRPLFTRLRREIKTTEALAEETWTATELLDKLGLYTTEVYQKTREEVIARQQQEMLELSTPVVKLWDGVLALPLIGTLDSARTQVVMESLLQRIVETGSTVAIIDITGVPTVDTLVAPEPEKEGRVVFPSRRSQPEITAVEVDTALTVDKNQKESIFHMRVGRARPVTVVRVGDNLLVEVDKQSRLAGLWLIEVPPFPDFDAAN